MFEYSPAKNACIPKLAQRNASNTLEKLHAQPMFGRVRCMSPLYHFPARKCSADFSLLPALLIRLFRRRHRRRARRRLRNPTSTFTLRCTRHLGLARLKLETHLSIFPQNQVGRERTTLLRNKLVQQVSLSLANQLRRLFLRHVPLQNHFAGPKRARLLRAGILFAD